MMLNQLPAPPLTVSGGDWKDWPDVKGAKYFDVLRYLCGNLIVKK